MKEEITPEFHTSDSLSLLSDVLNCSLIPVQIRAKLMLGHTYHHAGVMIQYIVVY